MKDPKPALVGAFVLSGFALLIIGLMLFAGTRLFKREVSVVTYFPGSVSPSILRIFRLASRFIWNSIRPR